MMYFYFSNSKVFCNPFNASVLNRGDDMVFTSFFFFFTLNGAQEQQTKSFTNIFTKKLTILSMLNF